MTTRYARERTQEYLAVGLMMLAMFGLAVSVWVFRSSQEARAFERVTGKQVSTWDAMFIDLRVMEGTRGKDQ